MDSIPKNVIPKSLILNPSSGLLLHSCCAPCCGSIATRIKRSGIECTLFFYNPNIYPQDEYETRKNEYMRFAEQLDIPFVDGDYDSDNWMKQVEGMENEPERGKRCSVCFDMRLSKTAEYAHKNNFTVFSTTLGLSRWKDIEQVNESGKRAAAKYPGLTYWDYNWRKGGGSHKMYETAKHEQFYKQEYCGCIYSLRDANAWRVKNNKPEISIKNKFYS